MLWKTGKNPPPSSVQTNGMVHAVRLTVDANDRDVIEACQRGDADAFRALFETYKDRVYSIALRYSGNPAAAMDIAQDTFLKAAVAHWRLSRRSQFRFVALPAGGE